jgi:hypothetical protein
MGTLQLDKYQNDNRVKWIVAQRIAGGVWVGRYTSTLDRVSTLDKIFDETPIGEMRKSEFAVFRNGPNILESKPRKYWRGCEVPNLLVTGGLINYVNSDFTINQ